MRAITSRRVIQSGFTLIEAMVTVAVLAIVIGVAIPNFTSLISANKLTAQSNELLAALTVARSEAIKQNQSILLCHSSTGVLCNDAPAGGWQGWLIRRTDNTEVIAAGSINTDQLQILTNPAINGSTFGGTTHLIRFTPQGLVRNASANSVINGAFRVCASSEGALDEVRDVVVRSGGRFRVTEVPNATSCSAPANPS